MNNAGSKANLAFTEEEASSFVGKRVLVGMTHCNLESVTVSQEQFHGTIDRINLKEGIVIKLNNSNDERTLPPDISKLLAARSGQYRLRATGEVVEDPDYTVMWTVYPKGYKD
jgi:hypothetical protein